MITLTEAFTTLNHVLNNDVCYITNEFDMGAFFGTTYSGCERLPEIHFTFNQYDTDVPTCLLKLFPNSLQSDNFRQIDYILYVDNIQCRVAYDETGEEPRFYLIKESTGEEYTPSYQFGAWGIINIYFNSYSPK